MMVVILRIRVAFYSIRFSLYAEIQLRELSLFTDTCHVECWPVSHVTSVGAGCRHTTPRWFADVIAYCMHALNCAATVSILASTITLLYIYHFYTILFVI